MTTGDDVTQTRLGRISRRSLIASSAGLATTAAVTAVTPPAVALARADAPATPIRPPATPVPSHPVIAYVHDAGRGEVTVVSGTTERTYHDPILVRRLLAAAAQSAKEAK